MVNKRSKAYLRTRLQPQTDDLKWKLKICLHESEICVHESSACIVNLPFGISSAKICPIKAKIVKNSISSRIVDFQMLRKIKNIFNKILFGLKILELYQVCIRVKPFVVRWRCVRSRLVTDYYEAPLAIYFDCICR